MALSMFLRTGSRAPALQNIIKTPSVLLGSTPRLFCQAQVKPALVQQCSKLNVLRPNIAFRNFSLTTPRQSAQGSHTMLWTLEKAFSVALLGLLPMSIIAPNPLFDFAVVTAMALHLHWGLESLVIDYVRPVIFGNTIPKVSLIGIYVLTIGTLAGLLYFNYKDIGFGRAVRRFWAIGTKKEEDSGKKEEEKKE